MQAIMQRANNKHVQINNEMLCGNLKGARNRRGNIRGNVCAKYDNEKLTFCVRLVVRDEWRKKRGKGNDGARIIYSQVPAKLISRTMCW